MLNGQAGMSRVPPPPRISVPTSVIPNLGRQVQLMRTPQKGAMTSDLGELSKLWHTG